MNLKECTIKKVHRFFIAQTITNNQLNLKSIYPKIKSRRIRIGEPIICINGDGYEYHGNYQGEVFSIEKSIFKAKKDFYIHAICALCNIDKMLEVTKYACEIGIDKLSFVALNHSKSKLQNISHKESKILHIIHHAMEQSNRCDMLTVNLYPSVDCLTIKEEFCFFATPHTTSKKVVEKSRSYAFIIGPEGGFGKNDLDFFEQNKITPIRFHTHILRIQTAFVCAALSIVNTHVG